MDPINPINRAEQMATKQVGRVRQFFLDHKRALIIGCLAFVVGMIIGWGRAHA